MRKGGAGGEAAAGTSTATLRVDAARSTGEVFCYPVQVHVMACGRRWEKTQAPAVDIATLALDERDCDERDCRQLVVAPTDVQARLSGNEVLAWLLDAWD